MFLTLCGGFTLFPKERTDKTHYTDAAGVKGQIGCREGLGMVAG